MQSKKLYDELGDTFGVPHGSGPFVVHEWLPAERIEAESRVDHWRQNASFQRLVFIQANEGSAALGYASDRRSRHSHGIYSGCWAIGI